MDVPPAAPDRAADAALRLARRVAALPEPAMRRIAVVEALRDAPPPEVVAMLDALLTNARTEPGPPWQATLQTLAAALGDEALFAYDTRAALYAAAKAADRQEIARLFFAAVAGPPESSTPPEPEQPVMPRGKPLTLGERKSLARGGRRDVLLRLARDPDAQVIRILLGNPRLTERDVVFIASRRPVHADVLRAVFESAWMARYAVKRTLVLNPYTPSDLGVRLVTTLHAADLRAVADDGNLSDPVRDEAKALLARLASARRRERRPDGGDA